jgi:hypothetical protein
LPETNQTNHFLVTKKRGRARLRKLSLALFIHHIGTAGFEPTTPTTPKSISGMAIMNNRTDF